MVLLKLANQELYYFAWVRSQAYKTWGYLGSTLQLPHSASSRSHPGPPLARSPSWWTDTLREALRKLKKNSVNRSVNLKKRSVNLEKRSVNIEKRWGYLEKHSVNLKGHGNEADFLGFLHKWVRHRYLTLHFEPFRFWLRIRGDIRNRKTTPRLAESGSRQECL
jgi:hypothetical protein